MSSFFLAGVLSAFTLVGQAPHGAVISSDLGEPGAAAPAPKHEVRKAAAARPSTATETHEASPQKPAADEKPISHEDVHAEPIAPPPPQATAPPPPKPAPARKTANSPPPAGRRIPAFWVALPGY